MGQAEDCYIRCGRARHGVILVTAFIWKCVLGASLRCLCCDGLGACKHHLPWRRGSERCQGASGTRICPMGRRGVNGASKASKPIVFFHEPLRKAVKEGSSEYLSSPTVVLLRLLEL